MATKKVNTKETTNKEEKTMKKSNNKKAKEVVTAQVTETKAVENTEKKNTMLNIGEVTALYQAAGIKVFNPEAKGNYRIMGYKGGSSLNIVPKKGEYRIYSTEADFTAIQNAELKCEDLIIEAGTNSNDKARPNTVVCKTVETLKALLAVYATNKANQMAS